MKTTMKKQEVVDRIAKIFANTSSAEEFRDMIIDYSLEIREGLRK